MVKDCIELSRAMCKFHIFFACSVKRYWVDIPENFNMTKCTDSVFTSTQTKIIMKVNSGMKYRRAWKKRGKGR